MAIETFPIPQEDMVQRITKEQQEAELAATREKELQEEEAKLEKEIEDEIRGARMVTYLKPTHSFLLYRNYRGRKSQYFCRPRIHRIFGAVVENRSAGTK